MNECNNLYKDKTNIARFSKLRFRLKDLSFAEMVGA